ncbi:hypothetical protein LguiB_016529 [Lonicera macranthoides]
MAASSSMVCTWLVAACMSVACQNVQPKMMLLHSSSPSRRNRSRRRRIFLSNKCIALGGGGGVDFQGGNLMSSFCGSMMSSCLAFEPCDDYCNSKGLSSSNFFGASIFGSTTVPMGRRRRRMINPASRSDYAILDEFYVISAVYGFAKPGLLIIRNLVSTYKSARLRELMAVAVQPSMDVLTKKKPPTKQRRVVVTGMGVETPIGHDPDVFYNNLLEGVSGISEIEAFDCSLFPTRIAGEIKSYSTDGWVAPKLSRRMDRFMLYMLTAGKKALANAGITDDVMDELDKTRCGVLIGSAMGGMKVTFEFSRVEIADFLEMENAGSLVFARACLIVKVFLGKLGNFVFNDAIEALRISYKKMNPFCVPFATTNMGSAVLAMDLGWMGPNYSISTACATSNFCILNAANHIIRGEADMMLCGGSDAVIIPIGLGGFVACRALSQRNSDPTKASRPWDSVMFDIFLAFIFKKNGLRLVKYEFLSRDGFVMGEGAGVLLLEELEHAKKRGATIYAEFLGGSFTCDAYHMTEPHPEVRGWVALMASQSSLPKVDSDITEWYQGAGVILCIEKALAQSGVSREDVNYINAHATSTPAGDLKEYNALLHCFGQNQELRVNSTKSMIGHLLGAAGAVEAVATVQAIRTGWVHPNINLENPDEGVDKNVLVGSKKERLDIKVALSNSFGFGGHNSSILFAPYK